MALLVKKFGGTSVGSIARINAVADYLAKITGGGNRCVCVVSAMAGQTNTLLDMAAELCANPPKREVDMLLTVGERMTMALLSIALHKRGVSAISLTGSQCGILTDQTHGNARISRILGDRIRSGINENKVVIVAGFQGVNPDTKEITTLGRGGTDLTAVAVAHAIKADQCDIYTDVDGVYSADPRRVASAYRLPKVRWQTVAEMAWAGAKVVHPRAAHLAYKFRMPVSIRNSFNLEDQGTRMMETQMESPVIDAISERNDRVYVEANITTPHSVVGELAAWLWARGESAALCSQGLWAGKQTLRAVIPCALLDELKLWLANEKVTVSHATNVQVITIIGHGFLQSPEVLQQAMLMIEQVPVATDTSNHAISICLGTPLTQPQLTRLHDQLIIDQPISEQLVSPRSTSD